MSFGFLGIQYGFGLQQANMSPIYRYLGAEESNIPGLWLAGPLTGLFLQPIIGALSDKSWSPRWGRRMPYILFGAIAGSIAMVMMPNAKTVFMAACLMTISNLMPFILPLLGISLALNADVTNGIPLSVRYPFYIGAAAIILTVLWTMYTTKEYPPKDESYKQKVVYTPKEIKQIGIWGLALSIGFALMGSLFALRLGGVTSALFSSTGCSAYRYSKKFLLPWLICHK